MRSLRPPLLALALAVIAATPGALRSQSLAEIPAGTRVRLWLPESQQQQEGPWRRQLLRGTLDGVASDTLRVTIPGAASPVAVPRSAVRKLEVSRGVSRPASAVERALGGALGGAVLFGLMNDPRRTGGPSYATDWEAAGVGAAWGAGFGALIGLVFPYERWHRVRLSR